MEQLHLFFKNVYQNFNDRRIDLVINEMTDDVQWANGMDGGYVYGHDGVREYWTKQFGVVSSNVTPLEIVEEKNIIKIQVHQVLHDVNDNPISDIIVYHYFTLKNNKIAKFDIGEKDPPE